VDAVVHLAAIPGATFAPNVATFDNNLVSTFHVFQAAKLFNIHNLVWASSETLLGYPFHNPPAYVPIDETSRPHPRSCTPLPRISRRRWPASTAAGTRIRR
jgi:nucleoside-diphosphate-sugar epimerase